MAKIRGKFFGPITITNINTILTLCPLGNLSRFFFVCWFFKINFFEKFFQEYDHSLDPDQARHYVRSGFKLFAKVSADNTRRFFKVPIMMPKYNKYWYTTYQVLLGCVWEANFFFRFFRMKFVCRDVFIWKIPWCGNCTLLCNAADIILREQFSRHHSYFRQRFYMVCNGVARTLKKLRTSMGDLCIKQWFSSIASLFKLELLLKERICSQREQILCFMSSSL